MLTYFDAPEVDRTQAIRLTACTALAGRPVSIDELIAEHHTKLHRPLDEELRTPTVAEAENAAPAGNAAAEPNSDHVKYEVVARGGEGEES